MVYSRASNAAVKIDASQFVEPSKF